METKPKERVGAPERAKALRPQPGPCAFCAATCAAEQYCFGCRSHVCEGCDRAGTTIPLHGHDRADHREIWDT